jgi:hypothetical protein
MKLQSVLVLFALSLLFTAHAAEEAAPCDEALARPDIAARFTENVESFRAVTLPLETIASEMGAKREIEVVEIRTKGGERFSERELFKEESDLIIGIDVMGNTQGHMYQVIKAVRIDGRMFFAPHTEEREGWKLSHGLLIRYKKLPQRNREALHAWLESPEILRTATCVAAACRIIYGVGGFENAPNKNFWFPSRLLQHLARTGLVGDQGEKIYPEIYTLNKDVYKIWENLPSWKSVPFFIFKVLFDPYTWKGGKAAKSPAPQT